MFFIQKDPKGRWAEVKDQPRSHSLKTHSTCVAPLHHPALQDNANHTLFWALATSCGRGCPHVVNVSLSAG